MQYWGNLFLVPICERVPLSLYRMVNRRASVDSVWHRIVISRACMDFVWCRLVIKKASMDFV